MLKHFWYFSAGAILFLPLGLFDSSPVLAQVKSGPSSATQITKEFKPGDPVVFFLKLYSDVPPKAFLGEITGFSSSKNSRWVHVREWDYPSRYGVQMYGRSGIPTDGSHWVLADQILRAIPEFKTQEGAKVHAGDVFQNRPAYGTLKLLFERGYGLFFSWPAQEKRFDEIGFKVFVEGVTPVKIFAPSVYLPSRAISTASRP